ncbi:MAG: CpXC domain-containing protein [Kiritimatiellaeota bacterium]|nr:CpXC domain-containing protein [Kiritimatiellota bacterium]
MSQKKNYSIRCPKCANEQEVDLFESVEVGSEPALREALMLNQLNAVTCTGCEFAFQVHKSLLYHDAKRGFMIYWLPVPAGAEEAGERQFADMLLQLATQQLEGVPLPQMHLVFSRTELIERIFLLEARLDERVIEYVKHLMYLNNTGKLDPVQKALLFNAQDSTDENLCFVVQDVATRKMEAMLHYSRKAYTAMAEMFRAEEKMRMLRELFPGPHISARTLLAQQPDATTDEE